VDLTAHTSLSPIRRGFAPSFVNCKKGCTRLAAASDKAYQLLAQGRWFPPGTPASSTTKTGRHDIAEILLKVALKHQNQIKYYMYILFQNLLSKYLILYFILNRNIYGKTLSCLSCLKIVLTTFCIYLIFYFYSESNCLSQTVYICKHSFIIIVSK
jgi:hypothetical protein